MSTQSHLLIQSSCRANAACFTMDDNDRKCDIRRRASGVGGESVLAAYVVAAFLEDDSDVVPAQKRKVADKEQRDEGKKDQ